MKSIRHLFKLFGCVSLGASFALLTSCSPDALSTSSYSTLEPTVSTYITQPAPLVSTIASKPSPTPDKEQQPPGYEVITPEFTYEFFDIPAEHSGQKVIAYWDGVNTDGNLDYLTFAGERGRLLKVNLSQFSENLEVSWPYVSDDERSLVINVDSPSTETCNSAQNIKRNSFVFNFVRKHVLGISNDAVFRYPNGWSVGDDYYVIGSANYCEDRPFYYFIALDDPNSVIPIKRPDTPFLSLFAQNNKLYGWAGFEPGDILPGGETVDETGNVYCVWDLSEEPTDPTCKTFREYELGNVGYGIFEKPGIPSPDGNWLEIRQGWTQPQKIGLIPFSCLDNQAEDCIPRWLPSSQISTNWAWDCQAILSSGIWTPDSQYLLFNVELVRPPLVRGFDPYADCKDNGSSWSGNEIWRYDLKKDAFEMLKRYDKAEPFEFLDFEGLHIPPNPIWSSDGKKFLVASSTSDEVYWVSSEDGEKTQLGTISGNPLGAIQLP